MIGVRGFGRALPSDGAKNGDKDAQILVETVASCYTGSSGSDEFISHDSLEARSAEVTPPTRTVIAKLGLVVNSIAMGLSFGKGYPAAPKPGNPRECRKLISHYPTLSKVDGRHREPGDDGGASGTGPQQDYELLSSAILRHRQSRHSAEASVLMLNCMTEFTATSKITAPQKTSCLRKQSERYSILQFKKSGKYPVRSIHTDLIIAAPSTQVILGLLIPGLGLTAVLLAFCGYAAWNPVSRRYLERVIFRLLTYALVAHLCFGILFTIGALSAYTGRRLVLAFDLNGRKMEKYYVIRITLIGIVSSVVPYLGFRPAHRLRQIPATVSIFRVNRFFSFVFVSSFHILAAGIPAPSSSASGVLVLPSGDSLCSMNMKLSVTSGLPYDLVLGRDWIFFCRETLPHASFLLSSDPFPLVHPTTQDLDPLPESPMNDTRPGDHTVDAGEAPQPDRSACRVLCQDFESAADMAKVVLNIILDADDKHISTESLSHIGAALNLSVAGDRNLRFKLRSAIRKHAEAVTSAGVPIRSSASIADFFNSFETHRKLVLLSIAALHRPPRILFRSRQGPACSTRLPGRGRQPDQKKLYEKLVEGTLDLVTASLVTYIITGQTTESGAPKPDKKVQLVLSCLVLLFTLSLMLDSGHGDGEAWNLLVPSVPECRFYSPAKLKRARDPAADAAFNNFGSKTPSPAKLSKRGKST
ncbi:hypothetical protein C8R45DRAFT_1083799 [Mycena sanguinolenta]|nr:hypothetical protein C8R45DRAFT_1083799 [Mycena sanguinolenta]